MKLKFIFYAFIISLIIIFLIKLFLPKEIINTNHLDILVNKKHYLNKFYKPYDLVDINNKYSYEGKKLRKEASIAFEKLAYDASLKGYKIIAVSAFRDYFYQKKLYNAYVDQMGKKKASKTSAKPGFSEHQTGLAIDVMGSNNDYNLFEKAKEFKWMKKNSYKYGFILRYPKGKENITGFKYEPWHYRYVGIKLAKYLYKNNLTLEEYKK